MKRGWFAAALALPLLAACGGDSPKTTATGLYGRFNVRLHPAADNNVAYTDVSGNVYDVPPPDTAGGKLLEQAMGCRLMKNQPPFCDSMCATGQVCATGDVCSAAAKVVDAGPLTMKGLGGSEFQLSHETATYNQPGELTLPVPPAAEGADVSLSSTGGPVGAFTVTARAVAPLVFTEMPALVRGQPLALHWTPPADPSQTKIEISVDISHHAGLKGWIACEVDDDGTFEIPASLVTGLLNLGVGPMPTIDLTRVAVGRASVSTGTIELHIESPVTREVTLP